MFHVITKYLLLRNNPPFQFEKFSLKRGGVIKPENFFVGFLTKSIRKFYVCIIGTITRLFSSYIYLYQVEIIVRWLLGSGSWCRCLQSWCQVLLVSRTISGSNGMQCDVLKRFSRVFWMWFWIYETRIMTLVILSSFIVFTWMQCTFHSWNAL